MKNKSINKQDREKVIRANKFELVDNKGSVCARLEMVSDSRGTFSKKGPSLTLFGANGQKRVQIRFKESWIKSKRSGESADIELCDQDGMTRAWLRTCTNDAISEAGGSSLTFFEKQGKEGAILEPQLVELATLPWGSNRGKKVKAA